MKHEEFSWGLARNLIVAVIVVGVLSFVMQGGGDSVPGGVIATPAVTSSPAATELVHGKSLFTSETIIKYVFFDARTPSAGPPTVVSTQYTDLTTLTQIRTDTTTEVLYRVPCHERVEVWNRTTWTVYLQPNVGLQGNQWNETTAAGGTPGDFRAGRDLERRCDHRGRRNVCERGRAAKRVHEHDGEFHYSREIV
jgi:hypothetical protein